MELARKFQSSTFYDHVGKFFRSDWYLLLLATLTIFPFTLGKYFVGLWIVGIVTCIAMILSEDILPSFAGFLFAAMTVFEMHGASQEEILSGAWLAIPVAISFVFHMIFYRKKSYKPGKAFRCQIAVAIAIKLAGVGITTAEQYFALPTLYFCCFLGFGMLGMFVVLDMYTPQKPEYIANYFAKTMMFIGFTVILMWLGAIIQEIPHMDDGFEIPIRQWKNNVGNLMLIAVPATLYYGTKSRHSWLCLLYATVELVAILFSKSRGATMVAIALAPFELVAYFILLKNNAQRWRNGILLAGFATILLIVLLVNDMYVLRYLHNLLQVHQGEARWALFREGIKNFVEYPIFGAGLGYRNDEVYPLKAMSIFWYHSTPIQILGSMGLLGAICYGYQLVVRLKLLARRNAFHIFMLFAFIGFEGYSCVNTGDFAPLPFGVLIVLIFVLCDKASRAPTETTD